MNTQERLDFARVAEAIAYSRKGLKKQPGLEQMAVKVGLDSAHFQRLFTNWAGVGVDEFLQYNTIEYAKDMLKKGKISLFETEYEAGLRDAGHLHGLFVCIERMEPDVCKNGGKKLSINYGFVQTPFGDIIMATTSRGICYMAFSDEEQESLDSLRAMFPKATYRQSSDAIQQKTLFFFSEDRKEPAEVKCYLKCSDFQLKVWRSLLKIPMGQLITCRDIAEQINHPGASRAVGSAVGDNPVSLLIPCHRVIRSSGELGGYHWGIARKAAVIGWEAVKKEQYDRQQG